MTDPTPAEVLKVERTPCPFCAGEPVYCCNLTRPTMPMHWILCRDCHAGPGDRPTEAEAWALWNQRPDAGEVRTYREGVENAAKCADFAREHCNDGVGRDVAFKIAAAIRKLNK